MKIVLIDTEEFINMPVSTRCLYFELLHKIDKSDICTDPATILKRGNYAIDDMILLIEKGCCSIVQEGIQIKM